MTRTDKKKYCGLKGGCTSGSGAGRKRVKLSRRARKKNVIPAEICLPHSNFEKSPKRTSQIWWGQKIRQMKLRVKPTRQKEGKGPASSKGTTDSPKHCKTAKKQKRGLAHIFMMNKEGNQKFGKKKAKVEGGANIK